MADKKAISSNVIRDLLLMINENEIGASNIASDLLELIGSTETGNIRSELNSRLSNQRIETMTVSSGDYLSEIEQLILRSSKPIEVNESEELTVLGQNGLWINKNEVNSWKGDLSIDEYEINEDLNPQVIVKPVSQQLEYVQELAIRYLRPPTPPMAGEIIITQEPNIQCKPAPPLIIRQQPPRVATPEPLVVREVPPLPPPKIATKRIVISGKKLPK